MQGRASRILIVEDDPGTAKMLSRELKSAGYAVTSCAAPAEARDEIRRRAVDLVLLDQRLPGTESGLDFYRALKEEGFAPPTVLVTGYAHEAVLIEALRAGVRDCIVKSPDYVPSLLRSIEQVLRQVAVERRLAETEARFSKIFQASPHGISLSRLQDGAFLEVNPAFLRMFGFTRDEVEGRTSLELNMWDAAQRAALVERLTRERSVHNLELDVVTKTGGVCSILATIELVSFAGSDCLLWFSTDVTERKRIERQRQRAQEELDRFFSQSTNLLAVAGFDGYFRRLNPAFEVISGYGIDELLSQPFLGLVHPEDQPATVQMLQRVAAGEEVAAFENRCRRKDGTYRWIVWSAAPHLAEGVFYCTGQDISERKRAEQALRDSETRYRQAQKMEAIGRLAGGVAHDFNNLLTIIQGNIGLALGGIAPSDPIQPALLEIAETAQRAATLTGQLLAFSRQQVVEPTVFDLNVLIGGMQKLLHRLIGDAIPLSLVLADVPLPIRADRGQIEQVLMNLAVNARDAMPRCGTLTIGTAAVDADDARQGDSTSSPSARSAMLSVADTGCGMTDEVKVQIFEPFFTTKELGKGSGLGLATVFGIVQQSGGQISVESEPGRGTTFRVLLPLAASDGRPQPAQVAKPPAKPNETVLLVEDEEFVRGLARRILEQAGYAVLSASSGAEALALAGHHPGPIDLLLTDVVMPGMDGRHVADQLRRIHPETRVLFVSGYADRAVIESGLMEEGTAFLPKPYTAELLTRRVREVLDASPQ